MTSMADLIQIMHDIDAAQGRVCRNCIAGNAGGYVSGNGCRMGYAPASEDDGCDDFLWHPDRVGERAMSEYGKTPEKAAGARGGVSATRVADNMFHGTRPVFHGHGDGTDDGPEAA